MNGTSTGPNEVFGWPEGVSTFTDHRGPQPGTNGSPSGCAGTLAILPIRTPAFLDGAAIPKICMTYNLRSRGSPEVPYLIKGAPKLIKWGPLTSLCPEYRKYDSGQMFS